MQIYFYPSLKCNLNCKFCYIDSDNFNKSTEYSSIDNKQSVHVFIAELIKASIDEEINLKLVWWEPLLFQQIIIDLLDYIESKGLLSRIKDITMNTNAVLIDSFIKKIESRSWKSKIVFVCSIHGIWTMHDFLVEKPVFTKVIRNLLLAKRHWLTIRFSYVVNLLNLDYTEKFIVFYQKYFWPNALGSIRFIDISGNACKNKKLLFIDFTDKLLQNKIIELLQNVHDKFPDVEVDGIFPFCLSPEKYRTNFPLDWLTWTWVMNIMRSNSLSNEEISAIAIQTLWHNPFIQDVSQKYAHWSIKYLYEKCKECNLYEKCRLYDKHWYRAFHENVHGIKIQWTDYLTTLYNE